MKLQRVNECNQTLTFSLGFCVFFATLKVLKMLRFSRNIANLGSTLKLCLSELISFSILFFIVWFAFVQLMCLFSNSDMESYSSLTRSMQSAFQIILGKFDTNEFIKTNYIMGPIIFSAYNVVIIYFGLNIFISIIVKAFDKVRKETKLKADDYDLVSNVLLKARSIFCRETYEESLFKYDKYRDHLSILPSHINRLVSYILRVI